MKFTDSTNLKLFNRDIINLDVAKSYGLKPHTTNYEAGRLLLLFLYLVGYFPTFLLYKRMKGLTLEQEIDVIRYYLELLPKEKHPTELLLLSGISIDVKFDRDLIGLPISEYALRNYTDDIKLNLANIWCGTPMKIGKYLVPEEESHYKILSHTSTITTTLNNLFDTDIELSVIDVPMLIELMAEEYSIAGTLNDIVFYYTSGSIPERDKNFFLYCVSALYAEIPVTDVNAYFGYEDYLVFLAEFKERKVKLGRKYRKVLATNIEYCYEELDTSHEKFQEYKTLLDDYVAIYHLKDYADVKNSIIYRPPVF